MNDIETIKKHIRLLDEAERHGENVTEARAFWCRQAVEWAISRLS